MDSALATLLAGSGVAGAFCILFVLGLIVPKTVVTDLKAEITELKGELAAQRDRADTAVAGNTSMRDLLEAIRLGRELSFPADSGSRKEPERTQPQLPGATT
jgi:hypothetical protein